jgi:hypothetical protein
MEWLIAIGVMLVGYGAYRGLSGQKIIPVLPHLPIGNEPAHIALADQVAQTGRAKDAAMALYGYLKTHGVDNSPTLSNLIIAFQSTANTDPDSVTLTGPLPTSGQYDGRTSAALTIYSHDVIPPVTPPAPKPPPPPAVIMNASIPGDAATSGFNLYTYLKAHGNDHSQALSLLVMQFQIDVNNDPKYPGPANGTGLPSLIKSKLAQTGQFDAPTSTALAVETPDKINP